MRKGILGKVLGAIANLIVREGRIIFMRKVCRKRRKRENRRVRDSGWL